MSEQDIQDDRDFRLYNSGIEEGKKHDHPSQKTLEMFGKLNVDIAELKAHFEPNTGIIFQILNQTTKTNGSVKDLLMSKYLLWGGLAIITILLIPLMSFMYARDMSNISETLKEIEDKQTQLTIEHNQWKP